MFGDEHKAKAFEVQWRDQPRWVGGSADDTSIELTVNLLNQDDRLLRGGHLESQFLLPTRIKIESESLIHQTGHKLHTSVDQACLQIVNAHVHR